MAEDFTAPSFSLGVDFDDDGDRRLLPGSHRREQTPREVAPEAPAFSLGIDDGDIFREQARGGVGPEGPSFSLGIDDDDDDDFDARGSRHAQVLSEMAPETPSSLGIDEGGRALDFDLPPALAEIPVTRFKRLRKGPAPPPPVQPPPPPASASTAEASPVTCARVDLGAIGSWEDDIEEFSEEERPARDVPPSVGSCSTSSSSKFSLRNHGVLMSQSTNKAKIPKFTQMSNASASAVLEESCTKKLLPKITISPMRKIDLLDSDTDSGNSKNEQKPKKPVSPVKKRQEFMHKHMQKKPTLEQNSKSQESALLQKSEAPMNKNWATPALDEFCEEYFRNVQASKPSRQKKDDDSLCASRVIHPKFSTSNFGVHFQQQSVSCGAIQDIDLKDPCPPSMLYFFHHDPMVSKLVRERLQHFVPIGAKITREHQQSGAENLSYMSQFGPTVASNGRWVTPNRRTSVPTNVENRRAHANGSQAGPGRWFTGEDGKKVYVSKKGQELTGRIAYREYKKDSGTGFRKSKKKGSAKTEGSGGAKRCSAASAKKARSTGTAKQGKARAKRKR